MKCILSFSSGDPETDWYTSNGNPASPAAYTFWLPGSPNSFDSEIRLCARFRYKSRYNAYLLDDADCENTLGFICERGKATLRDFIQSIHSSAKHSERADFYKVSSLL